ncbi:hypothetical protein LF1_51710 [Rubripirellula obstinata]|uniref:Uncharacterized protein n=1 Tax=Rubripirellula obstinata TaxID=406547 RepID=A0A5B1CTQ5_9BACT|nr:hypothetical protein [Rubripirellula obstinata]KAA1262604.1 hypothetical protein LF1_51710 [Rubripirellula obstinata]
MACLLVAIIFIGVSISEHIWPMAVIGCIFVAATYATSVATISHIRSKRLGSVEQPAPKGESKPTVAIMILLVGVYSWLLTVAIHIFDAFFRNGPGTPKYFVTLGIAISATLFMQVYGKRVVREHFGRKGGRNLELSPRQAGYVSVFAMACSIYFVWVAT